MRNLLFILLLVPSLIFAQTTYNWTTSGVKVNGTAFSGATVVGGDTIKLGADLTNFTRFDGYIGTAGNPIIIYLNGYSIDVSGASPGAACISFNDGDDADDNNHYITVLGDADRDTLISQTSGGYCIFGRSGNGFTFKNLYMQDGSQCIGFHNDYAIGSDYQDHYAAYTNGICSDTIIVDNCYAVSASNENYYLGASNTEKIYTLTAYPDSVYSQPVIGYVLFKDSYSYDAGNDGIQISANNMDIYDNVVYNHAVNDGAGHRNGIQASGTGTANVFRNVINGSVSNGIGINIFASEGDVSYNLVDSCRTGIDWTFLQGKHLGRRFIVHNTFTRISSRIIENYDPVHFNHFYNNIGVLTSAPSGNDPAYYFAGAGLGVNIDSLGNLLTYEGSIALTTIFTDPANGDYTLKAGSPAIGLGVGVVRQWKNKFMYDFNSNRQPSRGRMDAGAYKF